MQCLYAVLQGVSRCHASMLSESTPNRAQSGLRTTAPFDARMSVARPQRYGKSEGKANEKGIRNDAQLALDYVTSHPLLEKTKVVLYGQSIGGAVAADLAARNPDRIAGLIIENTFLNLVSGSMYSQS